MSWGCHLLLITLIRDIYYLHNINKGNIVDYLEDFYISTKCRKMNIPDMNINVKVLKNK